MKKTTILLTLLSLGHLAAAGSAPQSDPALTIDWPVFLARHDMIWKRLPGNWREASWTLWAEVTDG